MAQANGPSMFDQMYDPLNIVDKLRTCASCNLLTQLQTLIDKGVDVNQNVQEHTGNSAGHICCQKGHWKALEMLMNAGSNPDATNDFGITPIAYALKGGHVECVQILWKSGSLLTDPGIIWASTQPNSTDPLWTNYSTDILRAVVIASPTVEKYGGGLSDILYDKFLKSGEKVELVKAFLLTGNYLSAEQQQTIITNADEGLKNWFKEFQDVHTLQHHARLAIRKAMNNNCLFGSDTIKELPSKLKNYIVFRE